MKKEKGEKGKYNQLKPGRYSKAQQEAAKQNEKEPMSLFYYQDKGTMDFAFFAMDFNLKK